MTREELLPIAKPILFNTEMVRAILEGRKTVTRRIIKKLSDGVNRIEEGDFGTYEAIFGRYNNDCFAEMYQVITPPFKAGDYLYVRETWNISNMCADGNKVTFIYRGDKSEEDSARTITVSDDAFDKYDEMMYEWMPEWRPSIHMPKEAARLFLKVTDVRVERLQDMETADDSNYKKEGAKDKHDFIGIWNSTTSKTNNWYANPWVWVIEFEKVEVE